ncbi:Lipopolysaccharide kinase (Kdo/WaaP) family protein [Phycisphaerae bacterium RAS1]|nr:Lipopolysaccharide kinase (Kdo/WaaP) family protein [Phycisphaerae bacterium RAS1]
MPDTSPAPAGFQSTLRPGYPDLLDLPWSLPLERWTGVCPRIEEVPRGDSRHPVVFVNYDETLYALKELPEALAAREYQALRDMEERRLPVVTPVGHVLVRRADGAASIVVTRFLEHSLPYHALFMRSGLSRYRDHLLDALAGLLVQLHLAGVFWGDCSLNNTLFRRDAGRLNAYLVDAETSEVRPSLSNQMREFDLDLTRENVCGGLEDLVAAGALPESYPTVETASAIRDRYERLWNEITREELVGAGERYRIQERIRALNQLGFSVDSVELLGADGGQHLRLKAVVTDRSFHRDLLHSLTGLEAEEMQARQMLNEINERRAALSSASNRSTSLSGAAYEWLNQTYLPTLRRLRPLADAEADPCELYCQVLEHKWYLSEQAKRDVGHATAVEDFIKRFGGAGDSGRPRGMRSG